MAKTVGRIDWMPRKKVWRVILYQGKKDVPFGDFASPEEAKKVLQSTLRRKNPFIDAIATGLGFGAGLFTAQKVSERLTKGGKKKKNPSKARGKQQAKMPDPFAHITEKMRRQAWARGSVI